MNLQPYIFLLFTSFFCNQTVAQEYNFIKYSVDEGLPQSQVTALLQDSKAYIWFGTKGGGLSRFDGINFENFSRKDGLNSNYIQAIHEDNNGVIWIGTKQGLVNFNGNKFNDFTSKRKNLNVLSFTNPNDSVLWVGTNRGIYGIEKNKNLIRKVNVHKLLDAARVNAFFKTEKGIWVATDRGAFYVKENTVKHLSEKNGLLVNDIKSINQDKKGNIWLAAFGGGVNVIDEIGFEVQERFESHRLKLSQFIFQGPAGQMWIATQNYGISVYSAPDDSWTTIDERNGLSHNNVRSIAEDAWGNIWIATSGGGVNKYLGQQFVHYDKNDGLNGNRIYAIHQSRDSSIWLSVSNNGITKFDSLGFHKRQDSFYVQTKCTHIFEDSKSRMWFATEGHGIVMRDSSGLHVMNVANGLPSNWIQSILEDSYGDIWMATLSDGIGKIESFDSLRVNVKIFTRSDGLPSNRISDMKMDSAGRIWCSTKNGMMALVENEQIKSYGKKEGLGAAEIRSIAFGPQNRLWIGTAGTGILHSSANKFDVRFTPMEGLEKLSSENIYLLIFDAEGHLWAGSESGVDKILLDEENAATAVLHFGKNEGFLGIETCRNAAMLDAENNLWFGTMNGLTKHSPTKIKVRVSKPKIHFENIALFYKNLRETEYTNYVNAHGGLNKGLRLPYNKNHLSFDFKGINLDNPENIKYRWKLKGAEEEWSPLSKKSSVNYSNLPPGRYRFYVEACNDEEVFSRQIEATFIIDKAIWQELWFQFLALLFLGFLLFLFYQLKVRNIRKKEAEKRQQLEVENKLLQLEQKALQLQMNPHFIFNALNSIQSLVALKDFQNARTQIRNFASLMRGILTNSRQQKIALTEEVKTLKDYIGMEQFCQKNHFDYNIDLPEGVDPEELEIPPMLIQPFVENAILHGLSPLENNGKISIKFTISGQLLNCVIQDNGVGRERAAALKKTKRPGHQSVALQVTKERLEALKQNNSYTSLLVEDVKDDNGIVAGTKVTIRLPMEMGF